VLREAVAAGPDVLTVVALVAPPAQPVSSKSPQVLTSSGLTALMAGPLADVSRWRPERRRTPEGYFRSSDEAPPFGRAGGHLVVPHGSGRSQDRCDQPHGQPPCPHKRGGDDLWRQAKVRTLEK
jgi:hypothetical protein